MYKNKLIALLMIMMLAMGLLAGCSPVEEGYYNLMMEANYQKVYENSGSIELDLDKITEDTSEAAEDFDPELIKKILDQYRIDYSGKGDLNQGIFQCDITLADRSTREKRALLSIVYKDSMFYIKVDDLVNYLKEFKDTELNGELERIFGDAEYVTVSAQDLKAMMPPGSEAVMTGNFLENSLRQQAVYIRLLNGLVDDVYNKYQGNMITKNNNQYILTLQVADVIDIFKPVAIYTIENIDKLGTFLKAFVNGMNEEELAYVGLTNDMKGEMIDGIDAMVLDVDQNRDRYLNMINEIPVAAAREDLVKNLNDSGLVTTIEKKNAQAYDISTKLHVHSTPAPNEELDFTLNINRILKACGSVQVAVPTGKKITLKDLEKRMPQRMNIEIDDGTYFLEKGFGDYDQGSLDVRLENNQTYLPLRKAAEPLGEKIIWDETSGQAYVEQNGQRIIMTGMIIDNQAFVKSRDFERLGFKVDWNASERTITIER